ncbi:MAG: hypothetical protein HFG70_07790 [Hungatella sp.]|jgi:hypothetical protein|nr:hypothetical protein [Hungatella sp.]MCI9531077.1 hypothetical protein [Lachnospiraceae bacterium]
MANYINPEIAAHNIASAFCQHEIQNLPESAFAPGDIKYSCTAAQKMWELYSNVYDFVFDAAMDENNSSMHDE